MKWSQYNVYVEGDSPTTVIIFNTLNRNLVSLNLEKGQTFNSQRFPIELANEDAQEKLKRTGIIIEDNIDEKLLFKSLYLQGRNDKTMLGLFVSFSSMCNFACRYCYESYKDVNIKNRVLTFSDWEKILLFIKRRIDNSLRDLSVVLYGGEPLVNFDVVLKAACDLKEQSHRLRYVNVELITNGSLLDKIKILQLKDYVDAIQITLDGMPFDHNKRRPYRNGKGSFSDVYNNMKTAVELMGKLIYLRINVDQNNYERIPEFLDFLDKEGLSKELAGIGFSRVYPTQMEVENINSPVPKIGITEDEIKMFLELQRVAVDLGFKVPKNFIDGPCPLVNTHSISIDETLHVYKCPGFLYQKSVGFIDKQGELNINDNFWYEAVTLEPNCIYECIYGPICYGGCRWQSGALDKTTCLQETHDKLLKERIKIYARSIKRTTLSNQ